ncbi:hypothetical protein TPHV1_210007 [Treponema phagedenis]|uniref:Uncharacterized protein n=1 Tax=Treponema phagedenis TaxID=162 RepID=A0A0B7GT05_TREPH|nr:hypothetical protein TPHV1_210007 [Treponema phagedenis]
MCRFAVRINCINHHFYAIFFVYLYNKMLDRLLIVIYTIAKPKHATVYKTILLAVRRIL